MNQKRKMEYTSQKGITLIALVITIIVLLILAGVTISMVLGDDGIIVQAQTAKEQHSQSSEKELVNLAITESMTENLVNGTKGVNVEKLRTSLEKTLGADVIVEEQADKVLVKTENGQFEIVKNTGKITELSTKDIVKIKEYVDGEVTEKIANIADKVTSEGVIVANGYITNIEEGTKVGELRANFPSTYKIYEKKGKNEIQDVDDKTGKANIVTSGMEVKNGEQLVGKTIIFGDVNGDGEADTADSTYLYGAHEGGDDYGTGKDCFLVAGDVTGDGWIKHEDAKLILDSVGKKLPQNLIAKHPNDIIVETDEMRNHAAIDEIISSSSTFLAKNYEMKWDKTKECYFITLESNDTLTIANLNEMFTGKKVEVFQILDWDEGTADLKESGPIGNDYGVSIDEVLFFWFKK